MELSYFFAAIAAIAIMGFLLTYLKFRKEESMQHEHL